VIGVAAVGVRPRAAGMVVWSFHDYAVDVQDGPAELLPVLTSPGSGGLPHGLAMGAGGPGRVQPGRVLEPAGHPVAARHRRRGLAAAPRAAHPNAKSA